MTRLEIKPRTNGLYVWAVHIVDERPAGELVFTRAEWAIWETMILSGRMTVASIDRTSVVLHPMTTEIDKGRATVSSAERAELQDQDDRVS